MVLQIPQKKGTPSSLPLLCPQAAFASLHTDTVLLCLTPCHGRGNLPIQEPPRAYCSVHTALPNAYSDIFPKVQAEVQSLLRLEQPLGTQVDVVIKAWWEQDKMLPLLCWQCHSCGTEMECVLHKPKHSNT